ncbi:MAG: hypothetical protein KDN22_17455, partial [Verrucomicrobiae bacterium]|nr:hypothetical protein [Verrucomicrobiae bacterium]
MKIPTLLIAALGGILLMQWSALPANATLTRFIQIVKDDDVDTRFHLGEVEAFEVGVVPNEDGAEFDGQITSTNDIGDGELTTYGDGEFFPDIGTTDALEHGGGAKDPNNQLESGGAVWSTANGLAESAQYTLDLGAEYDVTTVRMWPRADTCCSNRWMNLVINLYGDDGGKPGTLNATETHTDDEGNVALEFTFSPSVDSDEDGMPDAYEEAHGLDPDVDDTAGDLDGDGISNFDEFKNGTLPEETDSDGDGLDDPVETGTGTWVGPLDTGTSPINDDTDDDGLKDGVETNTGSDPLDASKYISATDTGTDPNNKDTDGDGAADGLEVTGGTNPLDPNDETSNIIAGGRWTTLHCWSDGDPITDILSAEDLLNGDIAGECIEVKTDYIHFHDNAVPPYLNENDEVRPFPLWDEENGGDGFGDRNSYAIRATGQINIKVGGLVTFVCNSDDGFDLRIDGESVGEAGDRGRTDTIMPVELTAGIHDVEFIYYENGGGAGVTLAVYRGLGDAPAPNSDDWELLQPIPESDTDEDGMPDSFETANGLNPNDPADAALDKDGDGVSNLVEYTNRTNVSDKDTDKDGLEDGAETGTGIWASATDTGTSPTRVDSDRDGIPDGAETKTGTYVSSTDTGTDPNKVDSDGDTFADGQEVIAGSDPTDPNSKPEGGLLAAWDFEDSADDSVAVDVVNGIEAVNDGAVYVNDPVRGSVIDFEGAAGTLHVDDASFLNLAAATDQMTFVFWQLNADTVSSSTFWAVSPSSSGTARGAQAHVPWDAAGNIYFDTVGCCDGGTQRGTFTAGVDFLDGEWHHFAFVKDGEDKRVYIDGSLVYETVNTSPLPDDFTALWIGSAQ